MSHLLRRSLVSIGLLLAVTGLLHASTFGFRTDWTGRYPTATPSLNWSTSRNVVWATDLPSWSNATPVVMDDRLFVCSEATTLVCVRSSDGHILWMNDHGFDKVNGLEPKPGMPETHGDNGHSSATPLVDGDRIYALFGNGVAACHDRDGKRIWMRLIELPTQGWGHSASPVMAAGHLIVQINGTVTALNPDDGSTLWTQPGRHSFGSPVACRIGDLDLIVTPGGDFLRASDGKVLVKESANLEYCAPIVDGDVVYFITGDAHAFRMVVDGQGGLKLDLLWRESLPSDRYYGSPLLHDEFIYAVTRGQKLTVIDTSDGAVIYTQKVDLSQAGGGNAVYSSPASAGDFIFLTGLDGTTVVLDPGRTYVERARNALEQTRASPVFVGNRIYIRAGHRLYCIGDS